jgi:hypothetical protein
VVVAPLACASAPPRSAELRVPSQGAPVKSRQQVLDRDRALIAGLATSLAFGVVGLGGLLANANLAQPADSAPLPGMPALLAVSSGLMAAGFLTAIPFGVAVERHRHRYPEYFQTRPSRGPRPSASLRPTARILPATVQR